jgi:hypothetical protein
MESIEQYNFSVAINKDRIVWKIDKSYVVKRIGF